MSFASHLHAIGHTESRFIPHRPHAHGLTWLSNMGLLRIHGSDVVRFLQGQLTCDVATLDEQHWALGACCNAKGRMVANFVITRLGDEIWLRLPRNQVTALQQHLSKYAVFFKVTLENISEQWQVLAEQETRAEHTSDSPRQQTMHSTHDQRTLQWPQGREYWLPNATAQQHLLNAEYHCDEQQWQHRDIENGIVWVDQPTHEHWIPQNIDWHRQGGVSFSKGCYTGQEIVARLQYLGKSKKQLVRLHSATDLTLPVFSKVTNAEGKSLGELVSWHATCGLAIIDSAHTTNTVIIEQYALEWQSIAYTDETTS